MSTKLTPVVSTLIAAVAYDPDTETLTIQFKSRKAETGETIRYKNVTPEQYEKLMSAPSIGGYFLRNIREHHQWEKATDEN